MGSRVTFSKTHPPRPAAPPGPLDRPAAPALTATPHHVPAGSGPGPPTSRMPPIWSTCWPSRWSRGQRNPLFITLAPEPNRLSRSSSCWASWGVSYQGREALPSSRLPGRRRGSWYTGWWCCWRCGPWCRELPWPEAVRWRRRCRRCCRKPTRSGKASSCVRRAPGWQLRG